MTFLMLAAFLLMVAGALQISPMGRGLTMLISEGSEAALKIGETYVYPDTAISFDKRDYDDEERRCIEHPLVVMETVDKTTQAVPKSLLSSAT